MSSIEIEFADGTVLDEDHLFALRVGESIELAGVVAIRFRNVTFSDDIFENDLGEA